jgi:hypothetical protein
MNQALYAHMNNKRKMKKKIKIKKKTNVWASIKRGHLFLEFESFKCACLIFLGARDTRGTCSCTVLFHPLGPASLHTNPAEGMSLMQNMLLSWQVAPARHSAVSRSLPTESSSNTWASHTSLLPPWKWGWAALEPWSPYLLWNVCRVICMVTALCLLNSHIIIIVPQQLTAPNADKGCMSNGNSYSLLVGNAKRYSHWGKEFSSLLQNSMCSYHMIQQFYSPLITQSTRKLMSAQKPALDVYKSFIHNLPKFRSNPGIFQ